MATKRLEWSRRAQADRFKIVEFYAAGASPMIADEAAAAIQTAANAAARNPLRYREGKFSRKGQNERNSKINTQKCDFAVSTQLPAS